MKKYLELIRIKHWTKNLMLFIPLICSGNINMEYVLKLIIGFFSFSFMSSFVYIFNDINDIEKDKLHFRKKKRPLPSGKITKRTAIIVALILLIVSLSLNYAINKEILTTSLYLLLGYMIINILYSMGLKNIVILDIILLASGFIIRVYYGTSIINVAVSDWLFLTILNASLFLGFGKRKKELINNKDSRKVLKEYNENFLDKFQYITLGLMLVFYSLWAMDQNIKLLLLTIPLLIIIFMKYCLTIEKSDEGDPTTILYQDKVLLSLCLIYGLSMVLFLVIL